MALPKITTPTYELVIPSTDEKIKYRPFLVKEEKILLLAMESENQNEIINAIKQIVTECTFGKLKVGRMPMFDVEYLFLNIRAKSVGEISELTLIAPDDKKTKVAVKIDLSKIQVEEEEGHTNKVELTDEMGIYMKYPTVESALHQIRIEIKETKEHVIRYPHLAKNSYVKNQTFHDIGVFTAEFLYAGMEKEGWQFFDQIWAEEDLGITKRVSFRSELEDLITGSRHYQLLLGMDVESSEDHTANMIFQNIIKRFKKYQNSLLTNGSQEE